MARLKGMYSSLTFPDRDWLWMMPAVRAGKRMLELVDASPRVVFSSSPHMTNHLVAMELKRRCGLPWVADFRDLWALSRLRPPRSMVRSAAERRLEQRVCQKADHLVFVSESYRSRFISEYSVPRRRTTVIHNGFDPADFSGLPEAGGFPKFSIAHAGFFYHGERDPTLLFAAVAELAETGQIDLGWVAFDFYGHFDPRIDASLTKFGLQRCVSWHGYLGYDALLPRLKQAYCLLLIVHRLDDTVPSKLFDYMGCGRPVLAICPPGGTADDILREAGVGTSVNYGDVAGMKQLVIKQWQRWKRGDPQVLDPGAASLRAYTRAYQTEQLAAVFDRLTFGVGEGPGPQPR